jgi:hypothetical protein
MILGSTVMDTNHSTAGRAATCYDSGSRLSRSTRMKVSGLVLVIDLPASHHGDRVVADLADTHNFSLPRAPVTLTRRKDPGTSTLTCGFHRLRPVVSRE